MIFPKNKVEQFQRQVGLVLSDLSEPSVDNSDLFGPSVDDSDLSGPSVDNKLKLLMDNLNRDKDGDLPFNVPEEGDASVKECLKKFNELYLTWKNYGCNLVMLQSTIKKEIHSCACKYLGVSDKEIHELAAQYDVLFSRENIKNQQRRGGNNCCGKCCTIF